MNPEKRELYTIVWSQPYTPPLVEKIADDVIETMLETSDFKEATDLINRIKSLK